MNMVADENVFKCLFTIQLLRIVYTTRLHAMRDNYLIKCYFPQNLLDFFLQENTNWFHKLLVSDEDSLPLLMKIIYEERSNNYFMLYH